MKDWLSGMTRALRPQAPSGAPNAAARPIAETAWWHVMGFACGPPRSIDSVERRFRQLASGAHPDRGGSPSRMQELLRARAEARRQLGVRRQQA